MFYFKRLGSSLMLQNFPNNYWNFLVSETIECCMFSRAPVECRMVDFKTLWSAPRRPQVTGASGASSEQVRMVSDFFYNFLCSPQFFNNLPIIILLHFRYHKTQIFSLFSLSVAIIEIFLFQKSQNAVDLFQNVVEHT